MDDLKNLIEGYKELSTGDKRKELGREITRMTTITEKLLYDLNPEYNYKPADEYVNLFEENTSEDDYLTGLYEDVMYLSERVAMYYNFATDLYCDPIDDQTGDSQNYEQ